MMGWGLCGTVWSTIRNTWFDRDFARGFSLLSKLYLHQDKLIQHKLDFLFVFYPGIKSAYDSFYDTE
jgi:hypothetical protein